MYVAVVSISGVQIVFCVIRAFFQFLGGQVGEC